MAIFGIIFSFPLHFARNGGNSPPKKKKSLLWTCVGRFRVLGRFWGWFSVWFFQVPFTGGPERRPLQDANLIQTGPVPGTTIGGPENCKSQTGPVLGLVLDHTDTVAGSGTGSGIGLLSFLIKKQSPGYLASQLTTHGWVRKGSWVYKAKREINVGIPFHCKTHTPCTHPLIQCWMTKLNQECSVTCQFVHLLTRGYVCAFHNISALPFILKKVFFISIARDARFHVLWK